VTAPGFAAGDFEFSSEGGELRWEQASASQYFRLLEAAWQVVFAGRKAKTLALELDTVAFRDTETGAKLGLGSSAALSVALVGALQRVAESAADPHGLADQAHTAFQQQQGSGVDVAASCQGGLIRYKAGARLEPEQVTWPVGLNYCFIWTGRPVATTDKLQRFSSIAPRDRALESLVEQAESVADAFTSRDAGEVLLAMGAYARALRSFDKSSGLGIFANEHAMISAAAERHGLCYKPCGAGGGDIGVVLYTGDDTLDAFEQYLRSNGVQPLPLRMERAGLTVFEE
jgi:phosphomevalonate kinase